MLNTILLQDQAGWANIVMIVVLIAIFYFFMIRPQQKKPRRHQGRRPRCDRRRHIRQGTLHRGHHILT